MIGLVVGNMGIVLRNRSSSGYNSRTKNGKVGFNDAFYLDDYLSNLAKSHLVSVKSSCIPSVTSEQYQMMSNKSVCQ